MMDGFAFSGTNAYRAEKIIPVKELMNTIRQEYDTYLAKTELVTMEL